MYVCMYVYIYIYTHQATLRRAGEAWPVPGNATLAAAAAAGGGLPRPRSPMEHNGKAWPDMSFPGGGEMHIFAIGDWGGMDGSLQPIEGRPRIIAYKGGHTPGPHVFPRTRWNRAHSELLCSHDEFVECFNTGGSTCPAGCGFVPEIDTRPRQIYYHRDF